MTSAPPSPIFHLPFMDFIIFLNPNTVQGNPKTLCAKIERRLAGCLEAYGYGKRGREKCKDLVYDFHECKYSVFQQLRFTNIRKQRMKLYREGKLEKPFEEHIPIDGLIYYESV